MRKISITLLTYFLLVTVDLSLSKSAQFMKLEMIICLTKGFAIDSYNEFEVELVSYEAMGTLGIQRLDSYKCQKHPPIKCDQSDMPFSLYYYH